MNHTANQEEQKAEIFNYLDDFSILSLNEKRGIIKNAKTLLRLQKDNNILPAGPDLRKKEFSL